MKKEQKMLRPKFVNGQVRAINIRKEVVFDDVRDFFGRRAWIKFKPTIRKGWFSNRGNHSEKNWPIHPESVVARQRRLCLVDNKGEIWMNYPEHITSLRLLGLDSIAISCGPNNYPPYLLAGELWEKLTPYLRHADYPLRWKGLSGRGIANCGSDKQRSTIISPGSGDAGIFIDSYIEYPSLPEVENTFWYGDGLDWSQLTKILSSPTPGWPKWLYNFSKVLEYLGWPHCRKICWPQNRHTGRQHISEVFNRHRKADILGVVGAMSMGGDEIISCQVNSHKGGHASDVRAFNKILTKS